MCTECREMRTCSVLQLLGFTFALVLVRETTGSTAKVGPSRGSGGPNKLFHSFHFELHFFQGKTQGSYLREWLKTFLAETFRNFGTLLVKSDIFA